MAELIGRDISITVGTRKYRGVRASFEITNTIKPEPNVAKVTLWNLSPESRAAVQTSRVPTLVEAGYVDNIQQVFKGYLRHAISVNKGVDWTTTMTSGDGEIAWREARVAESFTKGTKIEDVLKALLNKLGPTVDVKNALTLVAKGKFREGLTEFTKGTVLQGKTVEELDKLIKSSNLEWFIQDGEVKIIEKAGILSDPAIRLTQNTGLIGSPEIGEDGSVKITALLQSGFKVARSLSLDSDTAKGDFRIEAVTHTGDLWETEWYSKIEARALGKSYLDLTPPKNNKTTI